ncbi:MAG: hypothetical protein PHV99_00495 [Candidatus Pacebacteria bacterium]|nr:hypothetical protein [Candidatus Paceibacterota bacterium]
MNNPFERFPKPPHEEVPFDPHSVPSMVTIEEQRQGAEIRRLLAKGGIIPQESVPETGGVNINSFRAPQYSGGKGETQHAGEKMQKDMDMLVSPQEGTPAELRKKLRNLVERLSS